MACFCPLTAYASAPVYGQKRKVSFVLRDFKGGCRPSEIKLPCGQCSGCRLQRSQHWAIRCMHELDDHQSSCFLTLTYAPEHLPKDGSLQPRDFVLFMKRLRKKYGAGIRFFHCGEYGDKLMRPHHHAIIFGFDFSDKETFRIRKGTSYSVAIDRDVTYYTSPSLTALWGKGHCLIGQVTYQSIAYVARYILKKVNGKEKIEHYKHLKPEYITMSRMPGIGSNWFKKFSTDVFPHDFVLSPKMKKLKPPRYYEHLLELSNPSLLFDVKHMRRLRATEMEASGELSSARLQAKAIITEQRIAKLVRPYEIENNA